MAMEAKWSQSRHKEKQTEQFLRKGNVCARFSGRMEFGQRALGNRSIIADPRDHKIVKKINDKIKYRDFWMPFAPIVLDEFQDILLKNPKKIESPFMTIAFDTLDGKEKIPASVHRSDGTARAQLLKKEVNPILWE